ncbi:hypothetical protein K0U83_12100 [bacterium]|nr:hypothetical protein [bacterium]
MSAKRPKVPRALAGLFWRVKLRTYTGTEMKFDHALRRRAEATRRFYRNHGDARLFRVTVWRKR